MIVAKTKIIDALVHARDLMPDHESECAEVAQSLNIAIEPVREVVAEAMVDSAAEPT